ncbi:hypothetical protein ACLOJK_005698 [Asimina triloba]
MQTRTVQVGNISDLAGEREIREFFSFSGDIEHIELQKGSGVGGSKTVFVTFKEPRALEIALLLSTLLIAAGDVIDDYYILGAPWIGISGDEIICWKLTLWGKNQPWGVLLFLAKLLAEIDNSLDGTGATIVDQTVTITRAENYIPKVEEPLEVEARGQMVSISPVDDFAPNVQPKDNSSPTNGRVVNKAQTVVTGMLAKGSAIGQEAMNKARAFDEKHHLTANASAKVISFDRRIGLTEKITVGISVVNEKVKSVDQRLHVSDKTMAALTVAERKLNDTGSAVKTNRYVSAGTAWLNGAFGKVAKAGHVAGAKTREKFQLAVSNLTAKVS